MFLHLICVECEGYTVVKGRQLCAECCVEFDAALDQLLEA